MINRVASSAGPRTMLNNIQVASRSLFLAQQQMTTGKRISRVSDNPADAVSALNQRANLRRNEQFGRNAEEARSWLDSADAALSSVNDRLTSARSLLVQANSAASDPTSRAAIAGQIRALRTSILQSANTTRDGRQIFGGTAAVPASYDAAGIYQGDLGTVPIPVSAGVSIQVNRTGPDVFGTHNASDPTNGDVFQLLESLAVAVETGASVAIGSGLTQIDAATTRIGTAQVDLGSKGTQLAGLTSGLEDSRVALKGRISEIEDIDFAESVLNVKTREAAYQAALQATAKVIQPSLMDFLR